MEKYLILENGMTFKGEGFGAPGDATAEIVFTTSMTGYLETLTDESYTGQAVVQTFPLMGNYGIIPEDVESNRIGPSAYIVREHCTHPSNFRSKKDLDAYLKKRGIVGLCKIDTRALTRVLREHGVLNGMITDSPENANLNYLKTYKFENPVSFVSTKEGYTAMPDEGEEVKYKVALLDFGMKNNICRSLTQRGCEVHVLPYNTTAKEILALAPDGLFLSNGPGDPEDNTEVIKMLQEIMPEDIPTMGICLGHQLLALANGFKTEKLKYGHRGANQPVRSMENNRVYITSQNHGYAVVPESIDNTKATCLFVNSNDGTNEGLEYLQHPSFSVQFHPEACGGPTDTNFLFDKFIKLMETGKASK